MLLTMHLDLQIDLQVVWYCNVLFISYYTMVFCDINLERKDWHGLGIKSFRNERIVKIQASCAFEPSVIPHAKKVKIKGNVSQLRNVYQNHYQGWVLRNFFS